jgi:Rrf2 family protein
MFNKETEYALRALVYIQSRNDNSRRPGIIEIAKEIEAPQFYIAKILQRLVRYGFIQSVKGKGGGFYFEENRNPVSLEELINFIEGKRSLNSCGFGLKNCDSRNPCPLHDQYVSIREAVNDLVSRETIQSLAKKYSLKSRSVIGEQADPFARKI